LHAARLAAVQALYQIEQLMDYVLWKFKKKMANIYNFLSFESAFRLLKSCDINNSAT